MKSYFTKLSFLFIILISLFTGCTREIEFNKAEVKSTLDKVAKWQIENFNYADTGSAGRLHDYGIDAWTNATLYLGMVEWAKISDNKEFYYSWLNEIGNKNNWRIPTNFTQSKAYSLYHADELCIGQFYLKMYGVYKEQRMIDSTKARLDWIMNNPPNRDMSYRNKQIWAWCDALFMVPPVYAEMAKVTGDAKYLEFMNDLFKLTHEHLFNKEDKLYFRDDSYFEKREANGTKIYWGRGNGWVAAGLANLLKELPEGADKEYYKSIFKTLVPKLATLQDENGFWHASLLDPESYPAPETSATALITYALAYGINNGMLNKKEYMPILGKAWNALLTAVDENGKLGWVQPIGADPKKVTKDKTAVYGVGAFLLTGTEIIKLAK